jgi:hypothetical protein
MAHRFLKNFLIVIVLVVLSWLGIVFCRWHWDNGALEKQIESHLQSTSEGKAAQISNYLDERKNDLVFLAGLPKIQEIFKKNELDDSNKNTFDLFQKNNGYFDLLIISMDGKIIRSSGKDLQDLNLTIAENEKSKLGEVFKQVKKDFGVGIFDPGYYGKNERLSIFITTPVLVDSQTPGKKNMIGILAAEIDNKNIENRMGSDRGLGNLEKNYLINRKGTPLTPLLGVNNQLVNEAKTSLWKHCFKDYDNYYFQKQNQEITPVSQSEVFTNYLNRTAFGSHQYILQTSWCALSETDKNNYLSSVEISTKRNEFLDGSIVFGAALFLFLIGIAFEKIFMSVKGGSFSHHQWVANTQYINSKISK